MKYRYLLAFILLISSSNVFAENDKYQITINLSPSIEKFTGLGRQAKLSYNFGLDYKYYLSPFFTFQTGIEYQNKGYKGPQQLDPKYDKLLVYTHYLQTVSIPTNFNIHIKTGTRNRVLLTAGLTNGYIFSQYRKVEKIDQTEINNIKDEYNIIYSRKIEKEDFFKHRFTGMNIGIGFMQFIKKKVVFEVHPVYTFQLNYPYSNNYSYVGDKIDKLKSFAINIKVGYYFNKQISQTEKSF